MKESFRNNWIAEECEIELIQPEEFLSNHQVRTRPRFLSAKIISTNETGIFVTLLTSRNFDDVKMNGENEHRFIPWTSVNQILFSVSVSDEIKNFVKLSKEPCIELLTYNKFLVFAENYDEQDPPMRLGFGIFSGDEARQKGEGSKVSLKELKEGAKIFEESIKREDYIKEMRKIISEKKYIKDYEFQRIEYALKKIKRFIETEKNNWCNEVQNTGAELLKKVCDLEQICKSKLEKENY